MFVVDGPIDNVVYAKMLLGEEDDNDVLTRCQAMSIFEKNIDGSFSIEIKNVRLFRLCYRTIALGSSIHMASQIFEVMQDETQVAYIGGASEKKITMCVRAVVVISLQKISSLMKASWAYSMALDASTHQSTSYLDVRTRVYAKGDIHNIHLAALLMFERHTGSNMFKIVENLFLALDKDWQKKLIGVPSDGAADMTGVNEGVASKIGRVALPGFFRVWCGAHQLDLVV